jgi:hypothetical protein
MWTCIQFFIDLSHTIRYCETLSIRICSSTSTPRYIIPYLTTNQGNVAGRPLKWYTHDIFQNDRQTSNVNIVICAPLCTSLYTHAYLLGWSIYLSSFYYWTFWLSAGQSSSCTLKWNRLHMTKIIHESIQKYEQANACSLFQLSVCQQKDV